MMLLLNVHGNIALHMQTSFVYVGKLGQGISKDIHMLAFLIVYYQFRLHNFPTVARKGAISFVSKQVTGCLLPSLLY